MIGIFIVLSGLFFSPLSNLHTPRHPAQHQPIESSRKTCNPEIPRANGRFRTAIRLLIRPSGSRGWCGCLNRSGATWYPAEGRERWQFTWKPCCAGQATVQSRAVDDSGNVEARTSEAAIIIERNE